MIVFDAIPLTAIAARVSGQNRKEQPVKQVRISNPPTLSKPAGYSHVAEVSGGKMVYIAGQIALDQQGQLVGKDDFVQQVDQVFKNLDAALKSCGATFGDVVKLNIFCVDRVDRALLTQMREIRDRHVNTQTPPVSTLVFVNSLVRPEWLIEIEAVAVV
jgi:enamine deaminase RidA (YjgF/YER057c/UK114 family)